MSKRTEKTVGPKINLADCCVPLPRHPAENGTCTQQAKKHTPSAYSEKLKNPRWQKKRLEIFERDGWKCRACQDEKSTLHVHHLVYEKGKEPWDYDNAKLVTLCEECHNLEREERYLAEQGLLLELREKGFSYHNIINLQQMIYDMSCPSPPCDSWGFDNGVIEIRITRVKADAGDKE